MDKRLKEMSQIMEAENRAMGGKLPPLNPEGEALAEHKRFTFDIVETPVDPLR